MKIYFACWITQASADFKEKIAGLTKVLKSNFEVFDFYGHKPGEAKDVYLYNKDLIDKCDLVVAECSQPSLGVGYEIGYALSIGKKVKAFALEDIVISRMITGNPSLEFFRYKIPEEVIAFIIK